MHWSEPGMKSGRNRVTLEKWTLPYTMMRQSALIRPLSLPPLSSSHWLSLSYTAHHLPMSASLVCLYRPLWTDVSVSGPAALHCCSGVIIHLGMGKRSMERWGLLAISYSEKDSEVVSGSARVVVVKHSTAGWKERGKWCWYWGERNRTRYESVKVHYDTLAGCLERWEGVELSGFWCYELWKMCSIVTIKLGYYLICSWFLWLLLCVTGQDLNVSSAVRDTGNC